ncbi:TetR/AcrR family transcriptional regulator [Nocardia sp. alder85J]|uniref:TetR/AcrR family transcriptional regulator n=1 Tax=Nocardia sp. alder85J TaxID=2862949 RepID=UPI001CD7E809|nr:TetR/AcrR family transcriptional regulator [Nocardia sp. alder85J]MCX4092913.1 TetR/AcrR family transcriptional regulator [Nocardia sp. alder85J]
MGGRREEILDAAIAIADEHGLDAVSMRAVAERIGVTPMALYRHVRDKSALLDGLVGRLLATLLPPGAGAQPWDRRLTGIAHAARDLSREHPWAAQLLFSRPATTPDGALVVDAIYTALLEAGVPDSEVPRLERLVSTFVLGFVASEAAGRFAGADDRRARRGAVPDGPLPAHARLSHWLRLPVDLTAEFDTDLRDLVQVIHAVVGAAGE